MTLAWKAHDHDAHIAKLMLSPPGETPEQQRARAALCMKLIEDRRNDLGVDPYNEALSVLIGEP